MSMRSAIKKQRRKNLHEMRMNKRKRRSIVDYSAQNMRLYQERLEQEQNKPTRVLVYVRLVMEEFTPNWFDKRVEELSAEVADEIDRAIHNALIQRIVEHPEEVEDLMTKYNTTSKEYRYFMFALSEVVEQNTRSLTEKESAVYDDWINSQAEETGERLF